ncbi:MAG: hypothetical protein JWR44_1244 [Hymenobacter sp.]|jgi:hypothetical protein|nr:hypothetical protein [Hymenobacter sp.]
MTNSTLFTALLLALPLAAMAQTKPTTTTTTKASTTTAPAPGTQQQTEVTEDLDPATGKVIRRTTRTINVPTGTTAPTSTTTFPATSTTATDSQVSDFFRERTAVSSLTGPALLDAYQRFIEKVRAERHGWKSTDWAAAAAVLSRLNTRYDQLRSGFSLDDKVTIRSQQAEFQALRTGRQLSDQVSDKL